MHWILSKFWTILAIMTFSRIGIQALRAPVKSFWGKDFRLLSTMNQRMFNSPSGGGSSTAGEGSPVFSAYSIYKGKAALSVKAIPPTIQHRGQATVLVKEGALLFEIAPAGANPREYDWSKKQFFALTLAEMGDFIIMDKTKGIEFFHDPNLGGQEQGKVTKRLKLQPSPDGKAIFFGLQINDKSMGSGNINLPVSWGEYEVIRTMAKYLIPKFLALDLATPIVRTD